MIAQLVSELLYPGDMNLDTGRIYEGATVAEALQRGGRLGPVSKVVARLMRLGLAADRAAIRKRKNRKADEVAFQSRKRNRR